MEQQDVAQLLCQAGIADPARLSEVVQAAEQAVAAAEHNRTAATRQLVTASDKLRYVTTALRTAQANLEQARAGCMTGAEDDDIAHTRAELSAAEAAYAKAATMVDRAHATHIRTTNELAKAESRGQRAKSKLRAAQQQAAEAEAAQATLAFAAGGESPHARPADNVVTAIRTLAGSHQPNQTKMGNPPELPFEPPKDLPGHALKPNPLSAQTPADFVALMKQYRIWAGGLSYRELVKRSHKAFGASTLCQALKSTQLPPEKLVRAFIWACSFSEDDLQAWATAWRRLRMRHQRPQGEMLAPVTALPTPQAPGQAS
ncbi:hypothetical protein [Nonomuraea insulae]|uniref:Uncharacterized protein n=1 Tax=Nonomuraea insulae TaxID=1616787 RepID=A0ABW1D535_9ACTN